VGSKLGALVGLSYQTARGLAQRPPSTGTPAAPPARAPAAAPPQRALYA